MTDSSLIRRLTNGPAATASRLLACVASVVPVIEIRSGSGLPLISRSGPKGDCEVLSEYHLGPAARTAEVELDGDCPDMIAGFPWPRAGALRPHPGFGCRRSCKGHQQGPSACHGDRRCRSLSLALSCWLRHAIRGSPREIPPRSTLRNPG
jgi:hypothetical protein